MEEAVSLIATQAREIALWRNRHKAICGTAYEQQDRAEAAEARMRTSEASNQWSIQVIGDLRAERDAIEALTIELLRAAIDATWGEALENSSVPSTKIQDKIIATIRALAKEPGDAKG